jgi:hypothetical protein
MKDIQTGLSFCILTSLGDESTNNQYQNEYQMVMVMAMVMVIINFTHFKPIDI